MKRFCARLLIAWIGVVIPLQAQHAYAQQVSTFKALTDSELRVQEEIKNARESRLSAGEWTTTGSSTPRSLGAMTGSVRMPKVIADPNDAVLANKAVQKNPALEVSQIVKKAQDSSEFAQNSQLLSTQDADAYQISTGRVDPEQGTSGKDKRINVQEVIPGYNPKTVDELMLTGQEMYDDPEQVKERSDTDKRRYTRNGCRQTSFFAVHKQSINDAPSSAVNRILKVEFFDIKKTAIPNTTPVEYQRITTPSTFKKGTLKLNVKTLGGTNRQWFEYIGQDYAIRYTYTPYSSPKNENYFTYNHRLAVASPGLSAYPASAISSFGTPKDAFTSNVTQTIPLGVSAVYLSADLYQTQANYLEIVSGAACQPDPPASCEVTANDGSSIRWCSGSPGAAIVEMYDDLKNPSAAIKARSITGQSMSQASMDSSFSAGVARGFSAEKSNVAQELAGQCSRQTVNTTTSNIGLTFNTEKITYCSNVLINPYTQACDSIKRSFGMAKLSDHVFVTVRGFDKIAVPIIDPKTKLQVTDAKGVPQFTYKKQPANLLGSFDLTPFPVFGTTVCVPGGCTNEIPDKSDGSSAGYYFEWDHTPLSLDPMQHAVTGVSANGGTATASHYGTPAQNWAVSGTAVATNMHEYRVMATVQMVTINRLDGCAKYLDYVADGYCKPGKLTCLNNAPSRTVGGVAFGPGLPTSGIVDILKKWGTDGSAEVNTIDDGVGDKSVRLDVPVLLVNDPMCWEARAEAFDTCLPTVTPNYVEFNKGTEIWGSDCHAIKTIDDVPLDTSSCVRWPQGDSCDTRMIGPFSGVCYLPNIAYNCGEAVSSNVAITHKEVTDSCSGTMRCLGTECHRPNLGGATADQFTKMAGGMEAWNMAKDEMTCQETGSKPTTATASCTPIIFGGETFFCKIPVGNGIGLTPHCCNDAKSGADSSPTLIDYAKVVYGTSKLEVWKDMAQVFKTSDIYNSTARAYGEVAEPVTSVYNLASSYITENFVQPLGSAFDSFFGSFGSTVSNAAGQMAAELGVDSFLKDFALDKILAIVEQQIMKALYNLSMDILGPSLTNLIFSSVGEGVAQNVTFSPMLGAIASGIGVVLLIYSVLQLIGNIVFKCQPEEYEWGMKDRWGLCSSAGTCCNSKSKIFGCVETRNMFCCYGSIATRVIAAQITNKNLTGTKPFKFKTSTTGLLLEKCEINCGGFSPLELASVDWGQVDLTEWTDTLIKADLVRPDDPASNYSVTTNSVQLINVAAREAVNDGSLDNRVPAVKTVEGISQNLSAISDGTELLRGTRHCYDDDKRKMPYTYIPEKITDIPFTVNRGSEVPEFTSKTFEQELFVEDDPKDFFLKTYQIDNYGQLWVNDSLVYQNSIFGNADLRDSYVTGIQVFTKGNALLGDDYDDGCNAGCQGVSPDIDITSLIKKGTNKITLVCLNAQSVGPCHINIVGNSVKKTGCVPNAL